MANISAFMESFESTMDDHRRQTIILKIDGEVRIYSRLTDGQKGLHAKWLETNIEALAKEIEATEMLTAEPVGVEVTAADEKSIRSIGYSPVLGTKCTSAHSKASTVHNVSAIVTLFELYEKVSNEDATLCELIIDRRKESTKFDGPPASVVTNEIEIVKDDIDTTSDEADVVHISLASVPPIAIAKKYISRNIVGDKTDFDVFDTARKLGKNVLLYGPTGPGKTTAIQAWSASRNLRCAIISGNASMEISQLFGKYILDGNNGQLWVDGPITDIIRNGGVIIIDELNLILMKILGPLYSMCDARRTITLLDHKGEVIQAHPDVTIFGTMNPDYAGTGVVNAAFRNRFSIQIAWDYDDKVESKLVDSKNLLLLAKQLRAEAAKGMYETPISTNMLIEFGEFVDALGFEFAVENFIAHFSDEDQASVRMVFQTHDHNLKSDFKISSAIITDAGPETTSPDSTESGSTTTITF